jgi:hypothetical protein
MISNFTLYADKVLLTANYYIEYLGFNLLYRVEDEGNPYVWLELNGQFLLIWPWSQKLGIPKPIHLEVVDIYQFYFAITKKIRIKEFLATDSSGVLSFSLIDCEGNIINFFQEYTGYLSCSEVKQELEVLSENQENEY